MTRVLAILLTLASLTTVQAQTSSVTSGALSIDRPWARASPSGATLTAGYLVIHNRGSEVDRLVSGATDAASDIQIHMMTVDRGVIRMRQLVDGLEIPAHSDVVLAPGGAHLMFAGLRRPLKKGDLVKADLLFERAGSIAVVFDVKSVGATSPNTPSKPGDAMDGMKM